MSLRAETAPSVIENVFGLRRSGHHAVIEWLKGCYAVAGKTTYHDNSVYNHHLAPFEPHWPDPTPETIWRRGQGHGVLIVSYEDIDPDERQQSPAYSQIRPPEFGQEVRDTFIVRDWFNFVASRLSYQANNAEVGRHNSLIFALEWPEVQERWLKYAGLLLNGTSEAQGQVTVNYNKWFTSSDYRRQLAASYGLTDSEIGLNTVPDFGSGSSFEGRSLDGQGRQMNVLRRWENLKPALVQRYKRLIGNPILAEINEQLFGIDQEEVLTMVSEV